MKKASEETAGLLCFANDAKPISGIIKKRYSDFHVHEIDTKGNVVTLTSTREDPIPPYPEGYEDWINSSQSRFTFEPESEQQTSRIYYDNPTFSVLPQKNGTVEVEKLYKKKTRPLILHFILYKENMNQQEAIGRIAKKIGKQKKLFGYAGNKDKRGITTQICSIRDIPPHAFVEATSNLGNGLKISNVHLAMNPISLGELNGNKFTIVLRDFRLDDFQGQIKNDDQYHELKHKVHNRINAVKESGFINYYGMQRFGTTSVPTYYIGILILKREWRKIIDILLEPQDDEFEQLHKAKLHYKKTHNAREASKMVPRASQTEYSLFEAISRASEDKNGNKVDPFANPHELFIKIDRKQRMLYVHSYQSYLWNHLVSRRIQEYGTKIVVGDYVLKNNGKDDVEKVTEHNIHKYTIFDVAIATPSANDDNDQKSPELIELMARDGVKPEMFHKLSSEYGASGGWRYIMAKAQNIKWELISHNDPDAALIDSDLDLINKTTNDVNHVKNGKYTSLCLSFSLNSGQYATMLLRELLKRSTESYTDSEMSQSASSTWWPSFCNIC